MRLLRRRGESALFQVLRRRLACRADQPRTHVARWIRTRARTGTLTRADLAAVRHYFHALPLQPNAAFTFIE